MAIQALGILGPDDLLYLFLPLSHSFGKVLLPAQLAVGFATAVDGRIPRLIDNLGPSGRPSWPGRRGCPRRSSTG
jgi:long-chain acyl-CoA synthetase